VTPSQRKSQWIVLLYAAVMMLFLGVVGQRIVTKSRMQFVDAQVYSHAAGAWRMHKDPYATAPGMQTHFIYSPLVLRVVTVVSSLASRAVWAVYLSVFFGAMLITPWLLSRLADSRWFAPPLAAVIFVFEPMMLSRQVAAGGNISPILYSLLLWCAVAGGCSGAWTAFYVAVFIAAVVKPMFLAFLVLPVLGAQRQEWKAAVTIAAAAACYGLQMLFAPGLYRRFLQAAYAAVVGDPDYGRGISLTLYQHLHARFAFMQWRGCIAASGAIVAVLTLILWLGRRFRERPKLKTIWMPMLLIVAILANPRSMAYDTYIGWVAAVFVVVEFLRTMENGRQRAILMGLLLVCFAALAAEDWVGFPAAVMLISVLLVIGRIFVLWRSAAEATSPVVGI
jgi:hypothetical protein